MSGSSAPEAARAAALAAWNATKAEPGGWDANVIRFIDAALAAAAPFIVAASVELQQEVDRLSAECEALRGTVTEGRATTGRRIEAVASSYHEAAQAITNTDAASLQRRDVYMAVARNVRAALVSPGEGE